MEIHDSVLDLIGNTPLVNLKQVAKDKPCKVVVKAEMTNPGGSSKDRPAVSMIDHAEREGLLKPGGTIVEPTSGNTGVGLAIVAAQRRYKCLRHDRQGRPRGGRPAAGLWRRGRGLPGRRRSR